MHKSKRQVCSQVTDLKFLNVNFLVLSPKKVIKTKNLRINTEKMKKENYTKYLGVIIDESLNWKQHIKNVNIKISKSIKILYKLRHFVPQNTVRALYTLFIKSHALYGILNQGCASKSILESLKQGVVPGIFRWGPDSSDEGAKIRFSGYYKCQKSLKNHFSPSDGGLACSDGGAIAPSPPLVPPLPKTQLT